MLKFRNRVLGCIGAYFTYKTYSDYKYEQQLGTRLSELNPIKPQQITLCERSAGIPRIGFLNMLLPTHHSIKIKTADHTYHLGLGYGNDWKNHNYSHYASYNSLDREIPMEAYILYKDIFGKYPEHINVDKLMELLSRKTPYIFGMPFQYSNGTIAIYNCRSALVDSINKSIE